MPQDNQNIVNSYLQTLIPRSAGISAGSTDILDQLKNPLNRPDWLNTIINKTGQLGDFLNLGSQSGGLENVGLAGDILPFAKTGTKLSEITEFGKLHKNLIDTADRLGLMQKGRIFNYANPTPFEETVRRVAMASTENSMYPELNQAAKNI